MKNPIADFIVNYGEEFLLLVWLGPWKIVGATLEHADDKGISGFISYIGWIIFVPIGCLYTLFLAFPLTLLLTIPFLIILIISILLDIIFK